MDFWQRAKTFADEAAKRSQEISAEAAKRSQELTKGAARFSQELVAETAKKSKELAAETAKKSKELAAEASKRADEIRVEALKRADQIKSLTAGEIPISIPPLAAPEAEGLSWSELERFGVTDELREFVKGITMDTFRDFPLEDIDEPEISDVPMVTNVRQDLNEWQAQHATLVLSIVKEISKYRYELCPRYMKERKFWRIYFVLVNNYVSLYEKQYMESRLKPTQSHKDRKVNESEASLSASKPGEEEIKLETRKPTQHEIGEKPNEFEATVSTSKPGVEDRKLRSKTSTSDHDLDAFLLGDLSSDEGPDDVDDGLDDDFDKIEDNLA